MFVALQSSTFAQSHTQPGSGATYHYDDWRKQPPQEAFDVAPAPAEGMHSFISRLDYPAEVRRRRVTGTMRVSVALDTAGQVQDVKVIQSVHPSLDRIVTSAIRKTRWTPALKHGVPIAAKRCPPAPQAGCLCYECSTSRRAVTHFWFWSIVPMVMRTHSGKL